jgi:hypothetical protein
MAGGTGLDGGKSFRLRIGCSGGPVPHGNPTTEAANLAEDRKIF